MAGSRRFNSLIALSFFVAALFVVAPLPGWAMHFRPDWVALALIFWAIQHPGRVGIGFAWLLGIMVDALTGSLFGLHALGLTVVAYLALRLRLRLRLFGIWQQASVVLVIVGLQLLLEQWLRMLFGLSRQDDMLFLLPAVTSAIFWPLASLTLAKALRVLDLD